MNYVPKYFKLHHITYIPKYFKIHIIQIGIPNKSNSIRTLYITDDLCLTPSL